MKKVFYLAFLALVSSCNLGIIINYKFYPYEKLFPNENDRKLLFSCLERDQEKFNNAKKLGADINVKGMNRITPLFIPIYLDDIKAFKFMLKNGANKYDRIEKSYSIMTLCIFEFRYGMIKELLGNNYDVNFEDEGRRLIYSVVLHGDKKMFDLVMKYKPELNYANSFDSDPISAAMTLNKYDLAKSLLELGSEAFNKSRDYSDLLIESLKTDVDSYLRYISGKDGNFDAANGNNLISFLEILNSKYNYPELVSLEILVKKKIGVTLPK